MAKTLSSLMSQKNVQDLIKQLEGMIPDKKLLKKYEALLEKKIGDLKATEKLEELVKPLRQKLEKSCLKPLEAKSLQDFSQRVLSVVKVQAKKKKKVLEKKIGKKIKLSPKKPPTRARKTAVKKTAP